MTKTEGRIRGVWRVSLAGGLGALLPALALLLMAAASLEGQDRRDACQCVDRDGNPIENCSCFRTFQPTDFSVFGFGQARARIGITVSTEQHARYERQGVHVSDILGDGPASEAGLEAGDIITAVGDRSVFDPLEDENAEEDLDLDRSLPVQRLLQLLRDVEPGEEVEIEYLRDGSSRRAVVTAEENPSRFWQGFTFGPGNNRVFVRPDELAEDLRDRVRSWEFRGQLSPDEPSVFRFRGPEGQYRFQLDSLRGAIADLPDMLRRRDPCLVNGPDLVFFGSGCVDGVDLEAMNPELGEYFGTEAGVLVTDVREESSLGLRPGDVLLSIDGREIDDPRQARRVLQSYDLEEGLTLRVMRRGEEVEIQGRRR